MKKIIAIMLAAVMAVAVLPLSACAKGLSGTVSTNGSTSMEKVIGILSEQFMEDNGDVTITYDATGSGTGIEAAANGTADIGLASRALKDAEVEKGLVATTVALDGIAIIVNENCPVDDLTVDQIAAIFTAKSPTGLNSAARAKSPASAVKPAPAPATASSPSPRPPISAS